MIDEVHVSRGHGYRFIATNRRRWRIIDAHQPYDVFLLHVQKLCDNPMKINKQNAIQNKYITPVKFNKNVTISING